MATASATVRSDRDRLFGPRETLVRGLEARNAVAIDIDGTDAAARLAAVLTAHGDPATATELLDEWDEIALAVAALDGVVGAGDAAATAAALNAALATWTGPLRLVIEPGSAWHLHADPPGPDRWGPWLAASSLVAMAVAFAEHGGIAWGRCAASGCDRAFVLDGPGRPRTTCSPRCASRKRQAAYRARRAA